MKKLLTIVVLAAVMLTGCGNGSKGSDDGSGANGSSVAAEANTVQYIVQAELANRGVSLGMTEEEVKSAEKDVNFVVDPSLTRVDTENTMKYIKSESPVEYNGRDAILSYCFVNDSLCMASYDIEVNYTSSELGSTPAYALFLDYTLKYTDSLGNPGISETDKDNSLWTSYTNAWYEGNDIATADYVIFMSTNQSKHQSFKDDYSDLFTIAFGTNNVG